MSFLNSQLLNYCLLLQGVVQLGLAAKIISNEGACKAKTNEGTIDLSSLANTDGNARFTGIVDPDNFYTTYEFNPCKDFSDGDSTAGNSCHKVSVCQVSETSISTYYIGMGSASSAKWNVSKDGNITITYSDHKAKINSNVKLICSANSADVVTANKIPDPDMSVSFLLSSKRCCAVPDKPSPQKGLLSVGTILCVAFLGFVCLYMVGGLTYSVGFKQAEGINRVPNIEFWVMLPRLVKDGVRFVFCKSSSPAGGSDEYESLKYDSL